MSRKKRVVVAMSGGVDSSVAASLLVDAGYDVIGLTMQTWPSESLLQSAGKQRGCCGVEAATDALSVGNNLGIPHYVLNFQEVFRKHVIENFAREYALGKTPNPCIRCNEFIKFKALLQKALALGADHLATGHYANVSYNAVRNRYILSKGYDTKKDQSYVLYPLTQEELSLSLFPLGSWTKAKVRAYAKERGLSTADKKESYDICFVPDGDYGQFVERQIGEKAATGPILDTAGKVIGEHQGVFHYTIGQRRGLRISSERPLYVLSIQPETNTLVVGAENELLQSELSAADVNWVSISPPEEELQASVRIRYHATEATAQLKPASERETVVCFHEPQKAITPGQSVVFYSGGDVLGGGVIK